MAGMKDLKDAICFPVDDAEDRKLAIQILDKLINDYDRRSESLTD